jgi:mannosyl-3-phosphoglycerate phosphatase
MKRSASRPPAPIVLFSDVDGTLLDQRDRLAADADDIASLAADIELVLASSRTLLELARIQQRLGLVAPVVGENGAVIGIPPRWRGSRVARLSSVAGRVWQVVSLGDPAAAIRARVRRSARSAGVQVVEQRELLPDRGRSLRRRNSVCIRNWQGTAAERFLAALAEDGLDATRSGHWITVTAGADKGRGVREVLARARRHGAPYRCSAAIGNAENDAPLLAACDLRFAIRNARLGHDPALLRVPRVQALTSVGLAGWREAVTWILTRQRSV